MRILLVILLAMVLASSVFIVTHAQHDHIGPGCQTCGQISICGLLLEWIGFAALSVALFVFARRGMAGRPTSRAPNATAFIQEPPLFSNRVRLNL